MKSKTIILIHGMFMNPLCWEKWIPYYEAKGYKVIAPAWPGRDKSVEELNAAHPDSAHGPLACGWETTRPAKIYFDRRTAYLKLGLYPFPRHSLPPADKCQIHGQGRVIS